MPFAYGHIFKDNIAKLKREGRYRIFADILRHRGDFPAADHHTANGVREITVWCSNDYLCMGHRPVRRRSSVSNPSIPLKAISDRSERSAISPRNMPR